MKIKSILEIFLSNISKSIKSRLNMESRSILICWQLNKSRDLEAIKRDNKSTSQNYSCDSIESARHNMQKGYFSRPFLSQKELHVV